MSDAMFNPDWTICSPTRDKLGESPVWSADEQALYWIDFYGPTIHCLIEDGEVQSWTVPHVTQIGSIVMARGGLLAATDKGLYMVQPETGKVDLYGDPNNGRPGIGYNDAKTDRHGRYWVGTYDTAETAPRGVLYCLDGAGQTHVGDTGYVVCNGPAFSPEGTTLYFSNSIGRRIMAYDLSAASSTLHNRRLFFELPAHEGMPDGLTVDAEGNVWVAHYGGGLLSRLSPTGRRIARYAVPALNVTSLCFGGPDLDTLFVTTGESTINDRSGCLLSFKPGNKGLLEKFALTGPGLLAHD